MRQEDIPEINNPNIRFPVLDGDKLMKEVLNGGYNVHPVPPPNSEIKERITRRYEREDWMEDFLLSWRSIFTNKSPWNLLQLKRENLLAVNGQIILGFLRI